MLRPGGGGGGGCGGGCGGVSGSLAAARMPNSPSFRAGLRAACLRTLG